MTNNKKEKKAKKVMMASVMCVVCQDDDQGTSQNPIFVCEDCTIGVHKLCYGIAASSGNVEPWWCAPCSTGLSEVICELCLQNGGAMKKTTCGKWVHVVCALFTEGIRFTNKNRMEPVNISHVSQENRGKKCIFCLKICGVCCKCTDPSCNHFLHVTCGQKNKCLKENTNPENDKIVFEAYCHLHKPKESSRRISSLFVMETSAEKEEQSDQHYDVIDISSDAIDESLATNSNINDGNDSKNGTVEVVADHFNEASYSKNDNSFDSNIFDDNDKTGNANGGESVSECGYDDVISDISLTHGTNIDSNVGIIVNTSTTCDVEENAGVSENAFWWDYAEIHKRENDLEAQLRSKDVKIDKVKNLYIIIKKLKVIVKIFCLFFI